MEPTTPDACGAPATFMQSRIFETAEQGISHDVVAITWRLSGLLNVEALTLAFAALVQRHGAFRTTFEANGDRLFQRVRGEGGLRLEVLDRGSRSAEETVTDLSRPFALRSDESLVRAALVKLGRHEHLLVVVLHHGLADGWSEYLIIDELARAYDEVHAGRDPRHALGKANQLVDYAVWESRFRPRANLLNCEPDGAAPDGFEMIGIEGPRVSPALAGQVTRAARRSRTTISVALATAAGMALDRARHGDVVLGLTDANRLQMEFRDVIGCLFDLVPAHVGHEDAEHPARLMRTIRNQVLDAYDTPGPVGVSPHAPTPVRFDVSVNLFVTDGTVGAARRIAARDRPPLLHRLSPRVDRAIRRGTRYYVGSQLEVVFSGAPDVGLRLYVLGNGRQTSARALGEVAGRIYASLLHVAATAAGAS